MARGWIFASGAVLALAALPAPAQEGEVIGFSSPASCLAVPGPLGDPMETFLRVDAGDGLADLCFAPDTKDLLDASGTPPDCPAPTALRVQVGVDDCVGASPF